jgi:hypothetical protein
LPNAIALPFRANCPTRADFFSPNLPRLLQTARQQIEQTGGLLHEAFWKDLEPA